MNKLTEALKNYNAWIIKGGEQDYLGVFVNYMKKAVKIEGSLKTAFKPSNIRLSFDDTGCVDCVSFVNSKGQDWRQRDFTQLHEILSDIDYQAAKPTEEDVKQ